jgi:hydrogenase-1 operon protein HyaF
LSTLDHIGITVEHPSDGNGRAVLREIEQRLALLLAKGEESSIDLSRLPFGPGDHALLVKTLGEGEVSAEVNSLGATQVRETAIPGVWWVTHLNADDEVMAEFIEVTRCPAIVCTPQDDLQDGVMALRTRLHESGGRREDD